MSKQTRATAALVLAGFVRRQKGLRRPQRDQTWRLATTAFATVATGLLTSGAHAEVPERADRHYEVWAGADVAENVWLLYSGTTIAPFTDIHKDGLRLRFVGGYGHYTYQSHYAPNRVHTLQSFDARYTFADALAGYLWRLGPLTAKAFAGLSFIDHSIWPLHEDNEAKGSEWGVKAVGEFWLNIGDDAYASLDLAWSKAHLTRSAGARLGYRVVPTVSLGPEVTLNMDSEADRKLDPERARGHPAEPLDYVRGGLFARYEWYGGEISASAGLLGDFDERKSVYGTVNWISQF